MLLKTFYCFKLPVVLKHSFCSLMQTTLLCTDISSNINCNTVLVGSSMISDNLKLCCSIASDTNLEPK
jgi:hypothetical protein